MRAGILPAGAMSHSGPDGRPVAGMTAASDTKPFWAMDFPGRTDDLSVITDGACRLDGAAFARRRLLPHGDKSRG